MNKLTEIFAEKLRSRRGELGMTQKDLAARLGYSEKTVSKWEGGDVIAPSIILAKLASVLDTDVNFLLDTETDRYYLGVDGGGSKTEFVLTDEQGRVVSTTILEGSNPVDVGIAAATDVLARGIKEVCAGIPTSSVSAFFGISGGSIGDNAERIRSFLKKYGFSYFDNGNDAKNVIAAALGDENGSIIIIGTGTVAFSQIDGELLRRGGYGYLFERGGSGFSIGRDGVMTALEIQERGDGGALCAELCSELGVKRVADAIQELYAGGKRRIASLAPAVIRAYEQGDRFAESILADNMRAIAQLIESTPTTDPTAERQRVVLAGGLASRGDIFVPLIEKGLSDPSIYNISCCAERPVAGALLLARKGKSDTRVKN